MMSQAKTHQILHEMFNSRDFDSMDDYMRSDLTYSDTPRGIASTPLAEFKSWLLEWATASSDAGRRGRGCHLPRRRHVHRGVIPWARHQ